MAQILKVDNINVYYGAIHAIKGVSFEVNQGEIVTMIGANGAGKSTTMNTVAGLLKPKSGSITFEGHDITSTPASKVVSLGLALCPEGRRVFPYMSVKDNLLMGAFTRTDKADIEKSLDLFYEVMGWDKATGAPTAQAYKQLGLGSVADELAKGGLLPK